MTPDGIWWRIFNWKLVIDREILTFIIVNIVVCFFITFQAIPYFLGAMALEFLILALQRKIDEHYSLADTVGSITAGAFMLSIA